MRALFVTLAACFVALLGGCGSADESTPVACLEGADAYERALKAAPDEVLLGDETLISECITRNQSGGDLSRVGEALIETATCSARSSAAPKRAKGSTPTSSAGSSSPPASCRASRRCRRGSSALTAKDSTRGATAAEG